MRAHQLIRQIIKQRTGIGIEEDRDSFIDIRLMETLQTLGLKNVEEWGNYYQKNWDKRSLEQGLINALTTNETLFFRDSRPFDFLAQFAFKEWIKEDPNKTRRIWCAACSTGQEPYSVSIVAEKFKQLNPLFKLEIVATDISSNVLDKAKIGAYSEFEIKRGLSPQDLNQYFSKTNQGWEIIPKVKQAIQFRSHNLLESYLELGQFDAIFCRNVLLYFDTPTKKDILEKMAKSLVANGYIFMGGSESPMNFVSCFKRSVDGTGEAFVKI
ncbi:MAG: protein-glutamate O-methyltransferase CheR [Bacteriovoracaceae bacterium]|nr:protein-glutamate O-methyltransferase CheR [Bacteriovoracaceae bacterium]